ncbi:hypothetical protein [Aquabacterium sp. CECT 9606]|uniref:hypothetical protein n=1 Tax=Aquabacterium sp. CECT 9606 TaxID=2845822 RepID=UPI001E41AF10|nr:hypothetical protein [Aquabacterium sp. CECT 9606]CAH0349314.1 hypothetical protein AQB9606_01009 [Aquabacterium sp. CECT 9606]
MNFLKAGCLAIAMSVSSVSVTQAWAQTTCPSNTIKWGVNAKPTNIAAIGDLLQTRHFSQARIGLWGWDPTNVALVRNTVSAWAAKGVKPQVILYTGYSRGYAKSAICNANLSTVEQEAYNTTKQAVSQVQDLVEDFELQNEVPLYPNMLVSGTTVYGTQVSDWNTPCSYLQAAVLRGMTHAIADEKARTGRPLRVILGTVNRFWGFLNFMTQQGVNWDVTGYHIYPHENHASLTQDPWFGPGGPIGQLALFNKPITINEFNCGETYIAGFENQAGQPLTEACFRSVAKHAQEIVNHTQGNIESVLFYSLQDDPSQAVLHERMFGLTYDLDNPKVNLFIATAFAGGTLSLAEMYQVTGRDLLTGAQVTAWRNCGAF